MIFNEEQTVRLEIEKEGKEQYVARTYIDGKFYDHHNFNADNDDQAIEFAKFYYSW